MKVKIWSIDNDISMKFIYQILELKYVNTKVKFSFVMRLLEIVAHNYPHRIRPLYVRQCALKL